MENLGTGDKKPSQSYRDLLVWQRAIGLATIIYQVTSKFPVQEQYGLTSQLRRAGVSVASNIAEGQARGHRTEFIHFLQIALGSLAEVDTQLIIANELGYIEKERLVSLDADITEIRRMLFGLIRNLP